jgi:hypothetical protein
MHLLSPVHQLRHDPEAQTRRLLCLLLLRLGALSAGADSAVQLQFCVHQVIDCNPDRQMPGVPSHKDWASGWRGLLLWGAPVSILLAASWLPQRYLVVIWPGVLTCMGVVCLANARRCGRVHCYATGPFFLILAAIALLYGLDEISLGRNGWNTLGLILLVGSIVLCCGPELLFGRYRSSRG